MPIGSGINTFQYTQVGISVNAPSQSGVYAIWNSQGCVYIGESGDIRARLLQHLGGDNSCITRHAPTLFQFELVAGEAVRVARQNQWIASLTPTCNQRLG